MEDAETRAWIVAMDDLAAFLFNIHNPPKDLMKPTVAKTRANQTSKAAKDGQEPGCSTTLKSKGE